MTEVEYLDVEDLLTLTTILGAGPVRDVGLLDSAAARPRSSVFGEDAYPTIELKAAALVHSICRNHALVDGNRRLALVAVVTFLRLNGQPFTLSQDQAFNLIMRVAEGSTDVPAIAEVLVQGSESR